MNSEKVKAYDNKLIEWKKKNSVHPGDIFVISRKVYDDEYWPGSEINEHLNQFILKKCKFVAIIHSMQQTDADYFEQNSVDHGVLVELFDHDNIPCGQYIIVPYFILEFVKYNKKYSDLFTNYSSWITNEPANIALNIMNLNNIPYFKRNLVKKYAIAIDSRCSIEFKPYETVASTEFIIHQGSLCEFIDMIQRQLIC